MDKKKATSKSRPLRYYFFCCIPFFSNEFLESKTLEDWIPLIFSLVSLFTSIVMYFSTL